MDVPDFPHIEGFDWDRANVQKNWRRHRVAFYECEELFLQEPLIVVPDPQHSGHEPRYFGYGRTFQGRWLTVVFTTRGNRFRVISARAMSRKERRAYAQTDPHI